MRKLTFALGAAALIAATLVIGGGPTGAASSPHLVSAFGQANLGGETVFVHTVSVVPGGANAAAVAAESLAAQGARPISSAEFQATGLVWTDTDGNGIADADFRYIDLDSGVLPDGITVSEADVRDQFEAALVTWAVATNGVVANLEFSTPMATSPASCPSLVRECDGKQFSDGSNDVGWVDVKGKNTLGVTWFTSTEADIALDLHQDWVIDTDGDPTTNPSSGFDIQTVILHEFGHALGLGHEETGDTVMNASYGDVDWTVGTDDINGLSSIYDGVAPPDPVEPTLESPMSAAVKYDRVGPRGRDLIVTVTLTDKNGTAVAGADEWIELLLDGSMYASGGPATTNDNGEVRWRLRRAPSGPWTQNVYVEIDGLDCGAQTTCFDGPPN